MSSVVSPCLSRSIGEFRNAWFRVVKECLEILMELWLSQNSLIEACVANPNSWYSLFIQIASFVT